MDAVAADALGRTRVFPVEQKPAVLASSVLRQLICGERRVEAAHERCVTVTATAKLRDPAAVFLANVGVLLPLRGEVVIHEAGGISAMTAGARQSMTKMQVLHDLRQVHVGR